MKNGKDQILQRLTCLKTSYFQIKSSHFLSEILAFGMVNFDERYTYDQVTSPILTGYIHSYTDTP